MLKCSLNESSAYPITALQTFCVCVPRLPKFVYLPIYSKPPGSCIASCYSRFLPCMGALRCAGAPWK